MRGLDEYATPSLIDELERRHGIEIVLIETYRTQDLHIKGPAVVLIIKDDLDTGGKKNE